MKRNARHNSRVDPISGKGKNGFSLNGGHRNIGGVGRFRLISNTTRTPFRGNLPMGSGGCCGIYDTTVSNSGSCCTNDPEIIKPSSVNTKGMIQMRYERKWDVDKNEYKCPRLVLNSQYPYAWTQQDNSSYVSTHDQGLYIRSKTQASGVCVFTNPQNSGSCAGASAGLGLSAGAGSSAGSSSSVGLGASAGSGEDANYVYTCSGNKNAGSYHIGGKKYVRTPYAKNFNQPAMSQEQYITTGGPALRNCLPPGSDKQPFPMNLAHNQGSAGCDINYDTWQAARNAGILPENYVG